MVLHSINNITFKSRTINFGNNNTSSSPMTENEVPKTNELLPNAYSPVNTPISYKYLGELDILGREKAKAFRLANGQNVIILPKDGKTIVKTYVNVGSMNEPDHLRGISHFIEHNLFNGTPNLKAGEFFSKVNQMGASTNASTSFSTTNYYISSQLLKKNDLEEKIKMHADMIQNPTFTFDMLEKEKGPVTSEISMVLDDANNVALQKAIKNLYQINSSSTDLVAGNISNIKKLTRQDVVNYYNTHYTPDNFTTVVTGDVDVNETMKIISKYFTKKNMTKPTVKKYENLQPIQKSIREDITIGTAKANNVIIAFAGPENNNTKETIAAEVLLNLLTGHKNALLKKSIEDMKLNIVSTSEKVGNKINDREVLVFQAHAPAQLVEPGINNIYKEIYKLQTQPINEEDLKLVKTKMTSDFETFLESSDVLNELIGSSILNYDENYLANYEKILKTLTPEDIQEAAKKYLDLDKASIIVVHPNKTLEKNSNMQVSFGTSKNNDYLEKQVYDVKQLKTATLPNNINLVLHPVKNDIVGLSCCIETPYPANVNKATIVMLSKLLNRGSLNLSNETFYSESERQGISTNFSVEANTIAASVKTNSAELENGINLMKESLLNPRFTQNDFELAKNITISQLKRAGKSAGDGAAEVLFPNLPFITSNEKLIKSLEETTLNDVINLYNYIMTNGHAYAVASLPKKNQNTSKVIELLSEDFPKFNKFTPCLMNTYEPLEKNALITQIEPRNQANLIQSFKFQKSGNIEDEVKFSLLNLILGGNSNSRLFNDLRETQKLAYSVGSNLGYLGNTGTLTLRIKTTTDDPNEGAEKLDNIKKSLNGFDYNIQKLKNELISDDELENAKLCLKTRLLDSAETSLGKNVLIEFAHNTPYGINKWNDMLKIIDSITKEDIQNTANYIFNQHHVTSVVASQKSIDHFNNTKNN